MKTLKPASRAAAAAIFLIALLAAVLFGISQYARLDYPVLCRVYGAYPIYGDEDEAEQFEIPYIECKAGRHQITGVDFAELALTGPDDPDNADEADYSFTDNGKNMDFSYDDTNGYYIRKASQISLFIDDEDFKGLKKPIALTTATVSYEDGTKDQVEIGKIVLYPGEDVDEKDLKFKGENNSEEVREASYMADRDLTIKQVQCVPDEKNSGLKINGKEPAELEGATLLKDHSITISLKRQSPFVRWQPMIKVTYQTADGKEDTQLLTEFGEAFDMGSAPTFMQTLAYLKEREVIR